MANQEFRDSHDWMALFLQFIKFLKIDSKHISSNDKNGAEFRLWTSQNMFLSELAKGLSNGVRVFYFLKSRQLGVTTISLAVDIFWLAVHPGTVGCLVIDRESNREIFRSVIRRYLKSFPKGFFGKSFEVVKGGDNRNFMRFSNGSRLDFLVAGTKRNTTWAEGKGYAFGHLTEVSKYGDSRGLDSFKESMTEPSINPNCLYIYESTANGYNHWYDMYQEAKRDQLTKHCCFIGWWANDVNRIEKKDPRYEIYGREAADEEEKEKIEWVKTTAGLVVTKEQLAWLRWRKSDTSQDALQLKQDQPWDDRECFVQSGQSFFDSSMINKDVKVITENPPTFRGFQYHVGDDFHTSRLEEIHDQWKVDEGYVNLRMYEQPVEGAYYVIGVDAALGRNDDGDRNTIEIFRCYADRLIQVAEYASNQDDTRECAWMLAYVASVYVNCRINIDVTGGHGTAIMNELDQLRQRMRTEMYGALTQGTSWEDFLSNASWYLYHRPDSMGAGYAKGWVWSVRTKWWACNSYRDSYACGMLIVNSLFLLEEMNNVVRDGLEIGASIGAKGRSKDDRVFAAILAEVAWKEWVRPMLISMNYTYDSINKSENASHADKMTDVTKNIVYNFFKRKMEAAEEFDERPSWMTERGLA